MQTFCINMYCLKIYYYGSNVKHRDAACCVYVSQADNDLRLLSDKKNYLYFESLIILVASLRFDALCD